MRASIKFCDGSSIDVATVGVKPGLVSSAGNVTEMVPWEVAVIRDLKG